MTSTQRRCPACALDMPLDGAAVYDGYYHTSPECWSVYTEVLSEEYSNMLLFAAVHQLTVDAYAVQHAGAGHKDKSVCVHLVGLHLALEQQVAPIEVAPILGRWASRMTSWPHFTLPPGRATTTAFDVLLARDRMEHEQRVHTWAREVWAAWSPHHATVAELARRARAGPAGRYSPSAKKQ